MCMHKMNPPRTPPVYGSLNLNIVQRSFLCRGTHGQADFAYAYLQIGIGIQKSDALSGLFVPNKVVIGEGRTERISPEEIVS